MDRSLVVISASVFFIMLGVGIVGPVLPGYALTFGVSYSLVGFVISAFGIARFLTDIPAGGLADRLGRKRLILVGIATFALAAILAAYAPTIEILFLSRFIQGVGAAVYTTTAMTLIADIAPPAERGRYMGYYQSSFFAGTTVGPAVGGFLADLGGFQLPFLALAAMAVFSAVFTWLQLPEYPQKSSDRFSAKAAYGAVRRVLTNRNILIVTIGAMVNFITIAAIRTTAIPLYGADGPARMNPSQIGLVLSVAAFTSFLTLLVSGSIMDRLGAKMPMVLGYAAAGAMIYAFAWTRDLVGMMVVAAFFGLSTGIVSPGPAALMAELSEGNGRGLAFGVFRSFGDLGIIGGPLMAGFLADHYGLAMPFPAVGLLCVATALLTLLLKK